MQEGFSCGRNPRRSHCPLLSIAFGRPNSSTFREKIFSRSRFASCGPPSRPRSSGRGTPEPPAPPTLFANMYRVILCHSVNLRSQLQLSWGLLLLSLSHLPLPYRRKIRPPVGWPFEPVLDRSTSVDGRHRVDRGRDVPDPAEMHALSAQRQHQPKLS